MSYGQASTAPPRLVSMWRLFSAYLLIETFYFLAHGDFSLTYILFNYNAYYFGILLLPLFFYFRESLDESLMTNTLILFFVPLGLLGIAQHFTGSALLPTDSRN